MTTRDERELMEKVVRAKVRLEAMMVQHREACPAVDPVSAGLCVCGADALNRQIKTVINELSFE